MFAFLANYKAFYKTYKENHERHYVNELLYSRYRSEVRMPYMGFLPLSELRAVPH